MNDQGVNENCVKITGLARKLGHLQAEARPGRRLALFIALSDIERAARKAQDRLNEIDYPAGFTEEQMGQ